MFSPVKGFLHLLDEDSVIESELTLNWRSKYSGRHDYVLLRVTFLNSIQLDFF